VPLDELEGVEEEPEDTGSQGYMGPGAVPPDPIDAPPITPEEKAALVRGSSGPIGEGPPPPLVTDIHGNPTGRAKQVGPPPIETTPLTPPALP
jgi:hypothetical protein